MESILSGNVGIEKSSCSEPTMQGRCLVERGEGNRQGKRRRILVSTTRDKPVPHHLSALFENLQHFRLCEDAQIALSIAAVAKVIRCRSLSVCEGGKGSERPKQLMQVCCLARRFSGQALTADHSHTSHKLVPALALQASPENSEFVDKGKAACPFAI